MNRAASQIVTGKGALLDGELMISPFGSGYREPESIDNDSSDEFNNKHYGLKPSMRIPD